MARYLVEFQSKYLLRKTEVIVYIPTNNLQESIKQEDNFYQNNSKKYPLCILLAGFGASFTCWERQSNIQEIANRYKMAVVLVGGENKWYMNNSPIDMWADFLNKELPDFLYGSFAMLSNKLPLYIAGCSMGGYGALRNYLENLDVYKACGVFSPATRPDGNLEEILHQKPIVDIIKDTAKLDKHVYLSIGENDFIIKQSLEMDQYLTEVNAGFNYKVVPGYGHCFDLWNQEIEEFFKYVKNLD